MTLSTTDPYLVVSSGAVNLGTVLAGGSATGNYTVEALSTCPQEHTADLQLDFSGDGGYVGSDGFSIVVGDILYAPTGPDNWGYIAYDPFDSPELPVYQWEEISADSGGPGTLVNFTSDDQVFHYELPFDFQYYGVSYDSFTVATNGWIVLGRMIT